MNKRMIIVSAIATIVVGLYLCLVVVDARADDPELNQYAGMALSWWGGAGQIDDTSRQPVPALPPCGEPNGAFHAPQWMRDDVINGGGVLVQGLTPMGDSHADICTINFNTVWWKILTHDDRCRLVFHEIGHLYLAPRGLNHIEGTIMSEFPYRGSFAVCDDFVRVHYKRQVAIY